MGNRATIVFTNGKDKFSPAVYLHWNGGPESVYGFLEELNRRNVRADQDYECARFIQIVGEFFDHNNKQGGHSLGVANGPKSDKVEDMIKIRTDKSDNGIYLVNRTTVSMTVRRFYLKYSSDFKREGLTEMSQEEVEKECAEAYKHEYGLLKEPFAEIANGRLVES